MAKSKIESSFFKKKNNTEFPMVAYALIRKVKVVTARSQRNKKNGFDVLSFKMAYGLGI